MPLVQYISLFTMYVYSIYLFDKGPFTDSLSPQKSRPIFCSVKSLWPFASRKKGHKRLVGLGTEKDRLNEKMSGKARLR